MELNIDAEIADLRERTVQQLRERYGQVFAEETRSGNKTWLIKRIAWRLQANAFGDLSERARRRALELANDADIRMKAPTPRKKMRKESDESVTTVPERKAGSPSGDHRIPIIGTQLTRKYKGQIITVDVRENGFECEGVIYSSLSGVAKAITGSHWNGYHFFGLNKQEVSR